MEFVFLECKVAERDFGDLPHGFTTFGISSYTLSPTVRLSGRCGSRMLEAL